MNLDTLTASVDAQMSADFSNVPELLASGLASLAPALACVIGLVVALRFARRWAGL